MDKQNFGILVIKHEQKLYRIAKSILKNDEDCADAAQEAVAKGFANLPKLKNDKYALTWLIRILINECYRIVRESAKTTAWNPDIALTPSNDDPIYSELYETLFHLPRELKIVLVLHYLEGYSIKEISDILQLPSGTIKSRMSRGRKMLKELLKEENAL